MLARLRGPREVRVLRVGGEAEDGGVDGGEGGKGVVEGEDFLRGEREGLGEHAQREGGKSKEGRKGRTVGQTKVKSLRPIRYKNHRNTAEVRHSVHGVEEKDDPALHAAVRLQYTEERREASGGWHRPFSEIV